MHPGIKTFDKIGRLGIQAISDLPFHPVGGSASLSCRDSGRLATKFQLGLAIGMENYGAVGELPRRSGKKGPSGNLWGDQERE